MVYHRFWISLVIVSSDCHVFDCWESAIRLESPQNFAGCIWIKQDGSDGAWPCIVAHKGHDDSAVFKLQQKPIVFDYNFDSSGRTSFVSFLLPLSWHFADSSFVLSLILFTSNLWLTSHFWTPLSPVFLTTASALLSTLASVYCFMRCAHILKQSCNTRCTDTVVFSWVLTQLFYNYLIFILLNVCVTQPFYTVFMCHQQTSSFWKFVVEEWIADPVSLLCVHPMVVPFTS